MSWTIHVILMICILLFQTLDLEKGSSEEQIKKRYKELAKKWHPDKFTNPEEKENAQEQ